MQFYDQLISQTTGSRAELLSIPIIQGCLNGHVSLFSYCSFLKEAYHHVRHTVPLLKACRTALPADHGWVLPALDEYIEEEQGHDEWILNDLQACGVNPESIRNSCSGSAVEIMVAFAYDMIQRRNPMGFFGMVHVLEGTSVALALMAADQIQKHLELPDAAFSYLRSHGTLDKEHVNHFKNLMNKVDSEGDQRDIVRSANIFYRLYGNVFRELPLPEVIESTT
jgi:pyrroloquinoline quinone (PQQ) biosynthesis protein C